MIVVIHFSQFETLGEIVTRKCSNVSITYITSTFHTYLEYLLYFCWLEKCVQYFQVVNMKMLTAQTLETLLSFSYSWKPSQNLLGNIILTLPIAGGLIIQDIYLVPIHLPQLLKAEEGLPCILSTGLTGLKEVGV